MNGWRARLRPLSGVIVNVEGPNIVVKTKEGPTFTVENRKNLKIGEKVAVCFDYTRNTISRILPVEHTKEKIFTLEAPIITIPVDIVHDDNFCTGGKILDIEIKEQRTMIRRGENRPFVEQNDRRSGALQPTSDGLGYEKTGSGNLESGALCPAGEGLIEFWISGSGDLELSACWLDDGYDGLPLPKKYYK
jgi:hypothetical protein